MKQRKKSRECAVVIGSYTNACSIIHGLIDIKYQHEIIVIDPVVNYAKCLTEIVFPHVLTLKKAIRNPDGIVDFINDAVGVQRKKNVFMTSEEFIEPIRLAIKDGRLKNTIAYTGSDIDNELIFDRLKFYQFIQKLGITNVPYTVSSEHDPYKIFGDEFIIRVNKSWDGNRKLPRLKIVHSKEEKEEAEKEFIGLGLTREMWSYQELLSTVDTHNVSVCGWHDREYHQYVVTRKILQHPPKIGNGDVVEVFRKAPKSLVKQTEKILNALRYTGPFEMEFVLDAKNHEYKLIELNPRFWMQHGLIEHITDNALIRRAVGQKKLYEIPVNDIEHAYWVNGTQAIYRLLKGQVEIIRYLKKCICVPSIFQAIRWGLYYRSYMKECNHNE